MRWAFIHFLQCGSLLLCRFYGASGEEIISIGADAHRMTEPPMPRQRKPNDLSRSLIALDMDTTLIAVVELSLSSWLVVGIVPGVVHVSSISSVIMRCRS
jgi:hypothetical protein